MGNINKKMRFALMIIGASALTKKFATGMNGDEDLGEDITMKGDKFHYMQGNHTALLQLNGVYGDGMAYDDGYGAVGVGVRPYSMEGYTLPDKVSVPDARITRTHTTFY